MGIIKIPYVGGEGRHPVEIVLYGPQHEKALQVRPGVRGIAHPPLFLTFLPRISVNSRSVSVLSTFCHNFRDFGLSII